MNNGGNGGAAGAAKKIVCRLPDGREFGASIKGDRNFVAELLHDADRYIGRLKEKIEDGLALRGDRRAAGD